MASTRFPNSDFIKILADRAGLTQVDAKKVMDALPGTLDEIYSRSGNQELEIPGIGVIEERNRKGQTSPDLGGVSYDVQVLSMRWSENLKKAIQTRSYKLMDDGNQVPLSDEEYESILREAA